MELIVLSSLAANEQTISCNLIVHQSGEHENVLLESKTVQFSKDQTIVVVSAITTSPSPPNSCLKEDADINIGLHISNCFSVNGGKVTDFFLVEPSSIDFYPSFHSASDLYRLWLLGMLPIVEISLHKKQRQWLSTVAQGMHSTHNFSMPMLYWGDGPSVVNSSPLPFISNEYIKSESNQYICQWNVTEEHIHWIWQMLMVVGGIRLIVTWIRRPLNPRKQRRSTPSIKTMTHNKGSDTDDDISSCSSGNSPLRKATTSSFFGMPSRVDYLLSDPRPRLPALHLPFARGRVGRRTGKPIHSLAGVKKEVGWARGSGSGSGSGCTDADSDSDDNSDSMDSEDSSSDVEKKEKEKEGIDVSTPRILERDVIKHRTISDATKTTVTATATTTATTINTIPDDKSDPIFETSTTHDINHPIHPSIHTPSRRPINTTSSLSLLARWQSSASSAALSTTKKSLVLSTSPRTLQGGALGGRDRGLMATAKGPGLPTHLAIGGRLGESGVVQGMTQGQGLSDRPTSLLSLPPPSVTTTSNNNDNNNPSTSVPSSPHAAPIQGLTTAPPPLSPATTSHWFLPAPHTQSSSPSSRKSDDDPNPCPNPNPSTSPYLDPSHSRCDVPNLGPSPSPSPGAVTLAAVSSLSFSDDEMMTMIPVVTVVESALDDLPFHAITTATTVNNNDNNNNNNDSDNNDTSKVTHHSIDTKSSDHHHHHHDDHESNFSFSDVYVTNHNSEETMSITAGAHLLTTHRSIFIASTTNHKEKDDSEGIRNEGGCNNHHHNNNNSRPPISPFRSPRVPSQRSSPALKQQRKGLTFPINLPTIDTSGTIITRRCSEEGDESCMWASVSSVRQEITSLHASLALATTTTMTTTTTTGTTPDLTEQPLQPMQSSSEPLPPSRWQSVVDMPRGHRAPFTSQTPRLRPSGSNSTGGTDAGMGKEGNEGKEDVKGTRDVNDAGEEDEKEASTVGAIGGNVPKGEIEMFLNGSDWLSTITSVDSKDIF